MSDKPVPRFNAPWYGHGQSRRTRTRIGAILRASREARAVSEVAAWSAVDMMTAPLTAPPCIIEPWLPQNGLAMIHGERGAGKTWLALALSVALASGGSVLGWNVPRPQRVLHLDGETPLWRLRQRLAAVLAGAGPGGAKLPAPEGLRIVCASVLFNGVLDLMTEAGQHAIAPHVAQADVIVIDSLSALMFDVAEGGDWRPAEDWLLSLRRHGRSAIVFHHAGRSGRPRGNAQKEDVLDTVIALRRPRGAPASEGDRLVIGFEKAREVAPAALGARAVQFLAGDGAARWLDAGGSLGARALDLTRAGRSQRECAAALGVSRSTVNRLLRRARRPPPPHTGGGGIPGQSGATP